MEPQPVSQPINTTVGGVSTPITHSNSTSAPTTSASPSPVNNDPDSISKSITEALKNSSTGTNSDTALTAKSNAQVHTESIPTHPAQHEPALTEHKPQTGVIQSPNVSHFSKMPLQNSNQDTQQPSSQTIASPVQVNNSETKPTQPSLDTLSNPVEPVSNEISSLDSHDEHVFSDAQFAQLKAAQATSQPVARPAHASIATTQPKTIKPMADIRPQSTNSAQQITSTQPLTPPTLPQSPQAAPTQPNANVAPTVLPGSIHKTNLPTNVQVPNQMQVAPNNPPIQPAPTPAVANIGNTNVKPKSKKGATIGSLALTVVGLFLVGAYVWQVNYPNLALKVASSKAGMNANLPGYLPNGYKISGDISASPGVISYKLANSENKDVVVSQQKTDWDSQALAENYVANKASNYLALQAQGLTIYVYGNNQASWVNHGTWYKIEGQNSGMSQDQIIRMATSL